jgi:hypothetical protein
MRYTSRIWFENNKLYMHIEYEQSLLQLHIPEQEAHSIAYTPQSLTILIQEDPIQKAKTGEIIEEDPHNNLDFLAKNASYTLPKLFSELQAYTTLNESAQRKKDYAMRTIQKFCKEKTY